jgi:hypothetical protein
LTGRVELAALAVFSPDGGIPAALLLIVPGLFFIHRDDGEVAEWSKALPC